MGWAEAITPTRKCLRCRRFHWDHPDIGLDILVVRDEHGQDPVMHYERLAGWRACTPRPAWALGMPDRPFDEGSLTRVS